MPTYRDSSPHSQRARALALAGELGVLRPRDLADHGISRHVLRRLHADGVLERRARGLYVPTHVERSEQEVLALVSARVPHGVICLLSALRFHDLTTQNPSEVWLAIDRKSRMPKVQELPLRVVRFSGDALSLGVDTHNIDSVQVRVYSPAKTVADCFKYRRKLGLEVALEALREYLRLPHRSMDELWHYAGICRVQNVMRPYMEGMLESS